MSTLVERLTRFNQLQIQIIEANGELTPELESELTLTEQSICLKTENYHFVIEQCGVSAKHFREKAAEMARIAKGLERAQDFLKENLKAAMISMETKELVAGGVKAKLVKCPERLVIDSEDLIPREFTEVVVKVRPDALKEALVSGQEVPGAHLEGGLALRFYPNKEVK